MRFRFRKKIVVRTLTLTENVRHSSIYVAAQMGEGPHG